MSKTKRERRAEAVKRLKALKRNEHYTDAAITAAIFNLTEKEWFCFTQDVAIDAYIEILSEDTCTRIPHPKRSYGPVYTCSVCGYGVGDDRWTYCPKCGSLIDRSKHGQD